MKLANILKKHHENSPTHSLENSFGDGFLVQNNLVFRSIRQSVLKCGFKFSNELNPDYLAFPMGQLEWILKEKKIPYLDNVSALQKINERTNSSLDWDHVVDNLKPNYVFHESCHAVARTSRLKYLLKTAGRVASDKQELITAMLIEESFANTCEFLAIAYTQDATQRLFLEMNSYFVVFDDRTRLKNTIEKYGLDKISKFMLYSYLLSNFLRQSLSDQELKIILSLASLQSSTDIKLFKSLAQIAFALNLRFRFTTTEMYLRLNSIQDPVINVLDFDPIAFIKGRKDFSGWIDDLISVFSH